MRHAILAAACIALLSSPAPAQDNPLTDSPTWQDMKLDVLGDRPVSQAPAPFAVEAPYRATDAAMVPLEITQTDASVPISAATIVIDENPAPVAARLEFSPAMLPLDFALNLRVNQYSNVRVIGETPQGLYMAGRFVKASGGCSAPAGGDAAQAMAAMGQMRLDMADSGARVSTPRRTAEIMIRHPMYSGLQRDQVTQLFISAHFIDHLEVWQGDEMLFSLDGGISVSEDPVFRFAYTENGAPTLKVIATDTEGNTFARELPKLAEG
ncbi:MULTISPECIES: quinoprotein dehydrogenase-associated SoxYZ-like carrier [unclassified Mameliella]|uniref:quinoprotein dehydrogenase-associated SoxYZ-like carrier n=1 Tax=unclassified Mameliella TaxID=2630630 RepID=UPI00273ED530|nr:MULTISPECIES: quinoprotein dehydrogenase-associated SoxYZ-like carrier [unclassified Mameliella]